MLKKFKKNITIGLIASFVPIVLMSFAFEKNDGCSISDKNYPQIVRTMLIMFVVLNVILLPLLSKFKIKNYFIIGAILSVVYSTTGRFSGIPQKIFKIDPNMFQLNALVLWTLYYGLVVKNLVE